MTITLLSSALSLSQCAGADQPSGTSHDEPILVLDAGGHTAKVTKVLFTPDGKELITVSFDKTIRTWDVTTGTPLRTLRPPIGNGSFGMIYTAALDPAGKLLAVAGYGAAKGSFPVYVIRMADSQLVHVLREHTDSLHCLAFAPAGDRLASGSADKTVKIWDLKTGQCVHTLLAHVGAINGVAYSPQGDLLASASADKTARLWDMTTGKCLRVLEGHRAGIRCIAWSKDGQKLVSGGLEPSVLLWRKDGALIRTLDHLQGEILSCQFLAQDHEVLFASSRTGADGINRAAIVDLQTGKVRQQQKHSNTVYDATLSPDGRIVASAGGNDHETLIWQVADGKRLNELLGKGRGVWAAAWSTDGSLLAWGNKNQGGTRPAKTPLERTFSLTNLEITGTPDLKFGGRNLALGSAKLSFEGRNILHYTNGEKTTTITIPKTNDNIRCASLLSNGSIAIGSNFGFYLFDSISGKRLRTYVGNTGEVLSVAGTTDGRYLLTACWDQVLRVWTLDRNVPLVSLFVAGNEWVAWTPEGYYATSAGGEHLMGWHMNNGPDKMALFYPAAHFRKSLYRPDVIKRLLQTGNVERALELADKALGKTTTKLDVAEVLPPKVSISAPDISRRETAESKIEVKAVAQSQGKHLITGMRILLNGRPYGGSSGVKTYIPPRRGEVQESWQVELTPGVNILTVQAESPVSRGLSDPVHVILSGSRGLDRQEQAKDKQLDLPCLYVFTVGVSDYPKPELQLKYAAKDAEVLAKTFQTTSNDLYRKVEVKVLTDKEATRRNILQGLTWLRKQMTQRDVAIFSFAGHGDKDADGKLYLLPVDVDKEDLLSTAVPGEQIKSTLAGIPGRVIVMLDACHSGAVDGPSRRDVGSLTDDLVRDLVTDDYGVIVMCSSMGREVSLESASVEHGFFTQALIEGLQGKADYNKTGVVYLNGLDLYVTDRVKELSQGKQHPVTTRPTSIRSFPLSKP